MLKYFQQINFQKIFTPAKSLLLLLLFTSFCIFYYFLTKTDFSNFALFDSDCYMRLIRVKELYLTGGWFNNTIPASNYPYGEVLHWSRPLDILLLAGTYVGMIFTDFDTALYQWGVLLSPTLYVLAVIAVYWSASVYYKDSIDTKFNCVLIFTTQLFVIYSFAFGRPDHHSLLLLLFILQIGCMLHVLDEQRQNKYTYWLAGLSAIAMWISIEAMVSIVCITLTFMVLGLYSKPYTYIQLAYRYLCSLSIFLIIIYLFGESLSEDPLIVYDKLSIAHIILFALAIPAICALYKATTANNKSTQIGYLLCLLILVFATCKLLPGLLNPYIDVHPKAVELWLNNVSEVQHIRLYNKDEWGVNVLYLAPFILSLPYLLQIKTKLTYKAFFLTGISIYVLLTLYQIRWSPYLAIIATIPVSQLIIVCRHKTQTLPISTLIRTLINALLIIGIILGPFIIFTQITPQANKAALDASNLKTLNSYLIQEFVQPQIILANCDFGAPILYNSQHKVISTSYHRNHAGILYFNEVMSANNYEDVQAALKRRSIDLIIVSPTHYEQVMLPNIPEDAFYNRLIHQQPPTWLTKISLPEKLSKDFIIYRVNK